jgi:NADH-quinone oxidoreductase subunit B
VSHSSDEPGGVHLGMPSVRTSAPGPARYLVDAGQRFVLSVCNVGLACCAVEVEAAAALRPDLLVPEGAERDDAAAGAGRPRVEVLVVSGTVTDMMAPAVLGLYEQLPEPRYVVSFGSCANSGGPYWDSYCVTKGVDQLLPVDVYVPGCPPRPEALLAGLRTLQARVETA